MVGYFIRVKCNRNIFISLKLMHMTVYLLFALQAGTYTLKIKFGEIK